MKTQLEKDLEKAKNNPSYTRALLQIQLSVFVYNAMLKTIMMHLGIVDEKFRNTLEHYIEVSKKSIDDYISEKTTTEEQRQFSLAIVDDLLNEYKKLATDVKTLMERNDVKK